MIEKFSRATPMQSINQSINIHLFRYFDSYLVLRSIMAQDDFESHDSHFLSMISDWFDLILFLFLLIK